RRGQADGLGATDAPDAGDLRNTAARQLGERAVLHEHLARHVHRRPTTDTGPELNREQFGVGEGLAAAAVQPLAWPLGLGPPADRGHASSVCAIAAGVN